MQVYAELQLCLLQRRVPRGTRGTSPAPKPSSEPKPLTTRISSTHRLTDTLHGTRHHQTFLLLTGTRHREPGRGGAGETHLSKNPSANIVNRMENLRRTVNIGRLREEGAAG